MLAIHKLAYLINQDVKVLLEQLIIAQIDMTRPCQKLLHLRRPCVWRPRNEPQQDRDDGLLQGLRQLKIFDAVVTLEIPWCHAAEDQHRGFHIELDVALHGLAVSGRSGECGSPAVDAAVSAVCCVTPLLLLMMLLDSGAVV